MALMNKGLVTFAHKVSTSDSDSFIYKTINATYYTNVTTTNVNGEINPTSDTMVYFTNRDFTLEKNCKGKLAPNKWTISEGDYLILGNDKNIDNGKLIIQIIPFEMPSKLAHIEVLAR